MFWLRAVLTTTLSFGTMAAATAKAAHLPLPQKVAMSSVVARVQVLSVKKGGAGERYSSVAKLRVLDAVKGARIGQEITLDFDNGLACPNVLYKAGDDCLVFLGKSKAGRFETVNTYFGKYPTSKEGVAGWSSAKATPWNTVVEEIRNADRQP